MTQSSQVKLSTGVTTAAAPIDGTWTISQVRLPLLGGLYGHNLYVLKDPAGRFVAELNGLATGADDSIKPIGFLPSDKLVTYVNWDPRSTYYNPTYDSAVVKSGEFSDVMASWHAGEQAGAAINSLNVSYPFLGIGANSNSVNSTLAVAMGVSENPNVANGSLFPSPGVGTILLSNGTLSNIMEINGITGSIPVAPPPPPQMTTAELNAIVNTFRESIYEFDPDRRPITADMDLQESLEYMGFATPPLGGADIDYPITSYSVVYPCVEAATVNLGGQIGIGWDTNKYFTQSDMDGNGVANYTEWFPPDQAAFYMQQSTPPTGGDLMSLYDLTLLDSNSDLRLDVQDPEWANLRLWIDIIDAGKFSSDEGFSPQELGINNIQLIQTKMMSGWYTLDASVNWDTGTNQRILHHDLIHQGDGYAAPNAQYKDFTYYY